MNMEQPPLPTDAEKVQAVQSQVTSQDGLTFIDSGMVGHHRQFTIDGIRDERGPLVLAIDEVAWQGLTIMQLREMVTHAFVERQQLNETT